MPRETHAPGPKTHVTPLQRYISTLLTCKVTLACRHDREWLPFFTAMTRTDFLTSTLGGNPGPLGTWLASKEALRTAGPRFAPETVWEYDD